ncbi:hypothetical protein ACFLRM_03325 [Acidobacteriota bacterium]
MKAKEIILLIFIVVAGVIFYYAQTGQLHINIDWDGGFFFYQEEFSFDELQVIDPPFPRELKLINAHSDVAVQGTGEEKITISFKKTIRSKDEEEAKEVSDKLKMVIDKNGDLLKISTTREKFKRKRFRTDFKIFLPANMDIKVDNSYGLVEVSRVGNTNINNPHGETIVSDINGELIIQNSYENIDVKRIETDCRIDNKHASVHINDVKGNTTIFHKYGEIHLENLSQDVSIDGSHSEIFGRKLAGPIKIETSYENIILFDIGPTEIKSNHSDVEIKGAENNLSITDRYGKVELNDIRGDLKVEGKNLEVYGNTIHGEKILISTSYEDIELYEFSGEAKIFLAHGDMLLKPSPLSHDLEVKGEYAGIDLHWPTGEKYPVEAKSQGGEIKWNIPAELSFKEENSLSVIRAFIQEIGKPSILLSTTYGDIKIEE